MALESALKHIGKIFYRQVERGFFDFNVTGFIIGCLIVGVAIGIGVAYLVPWLWSFIKPLIHALTA